MPEKYDIIGQRYNDTRKADPYLASRLWALLAPQPGDTCLDIGCGTGNYTLALQQKGLDMIGVEPSTQMLETAKARGQAIDWRQGKAEAIPLAEASVDRAVAVLTLHHWTDLTSGFQEVYRVLKPGGKWVILAATPHQTAKYWVTHYFPKMIQKSVEQLPSMDQITQAFSAAGFEQIELETYEVHDELEDLFLYAGKNRPWLYFDPKVRQGISSFADLAFQEEVEEGLRKLKEDLDTGKWAAVREQYLHKEGDYLFISGRKED